jgi:hypothetical protein
MKKPDEDVALDLDDATVARVDALLPKLARPGHEPTRADVLRAMIETALERAEKDASFLDR